MMWLSRQINRHESRPNLPISINNWSFTYQLDWWMGGWLKPWATHHVKRSERIFGIYTEVCTCSHLRKYFIVWQFSMPEMSELSRQFWTFDALSCWFVRVRTGSEKSVKVVLAVKSQWNWAHGEKLGKCQWIWLVGSENDKRELNLSPNWCKMCGPWTNNTEPIGQRHRVHFSYRNHNFDYKVFNNHYR